MKANHESFWLRTVSTKLPTLFSWHDRCGVVHQNFPRNSIHWVGLPEILIMASLLRIVPGELRWEGFSETYFREGGIFMSKFRIEPHGRLQEWVAGEKG